MYSSHKQKSKKKKKRSNNDLDVDQRKIAQRWIIIYIFKSDKIRYIKRYNIIEVK